MEPEMTPATTTTDFTPTPGMQQVQNAIEFVETHVLQPDVKPMQGTAKLMADQAAAMMIQDMRSFLQGNEQFLTLAAAKAIAMILEGNPNGEIALTQIEGFMDKLPLYATAIGTAASGIVSGFEGGAASPTPAQAAIKSTPKDQQETEEEDNEEEEVEEDID